MKENVFKIFDKGLPYEELVQTEEYRQIMCSSDMSLSHLIANTNYTLHLNGDLDSILIRENEIVLNVVYAYLGTTPQNVVVRVLEKNLQKSVRKNLYCGNHVELEIGGFWRTGGSMYNNDFELRAILNAKKGTRKFKHYVCEDCGYDFGYSNEKHENCICCGGRLELR